MKNSEIIKQAKREIEAEDKRDKVEQVKNILRQIEVVEQQLCELRKQLSEV